MKRRNFVFTALAGAGALSILPSSVLFGSTSGMTINSFGSGLTCLLKQKSVQKCSLPLPSDKLMSLIPAGFKAVSNAAFQYGPDHYFVPLIKESGLLSVPEKGALIIVGKSNKSIFLSENLLTHMDGIFSQIHSGFENNSDLQSAMVREFLPFREVKMKDKAADHYAFSYLNSSGQPIGFFGSDGKTYCKIGIA